MLAFLLLCFPSATWAAQDATPLHLAQNQVAVWNGGSLDQDRFDRFLGANAHYQQTGVQALTHLLQIRLVEIEADARGFKPNPAAVDARIQKAREQIEAAGQSLETILASRQMGMQEFRKLIADSLLHEDLVRADLQLPVEEAVTAEMLQSWTDQHIANLQEKAKSAPPGMVLDAPPYRISEQELGAILRQTMGNDDLVDRVEQLVLMEALPAWAQAEKLPLTDDVLYQEIEWRRKRVEENPAYGGATYEGLLQVKNSSIEAVLKSDELRVAGYLRLLAKQQFPDSWFENLEAEQRADIEAEYGASRYIGWILLRAHEEKTDDLDLTFEEAEKELLKLRERMRNADDFRSLATDYSEDEATRRRAGMLGWVHAREDGVPQALCDAAFAAPGKGIFGPVKIVDANPFQPLSGMALVLIADLRESPPQAELRALYRRGQHKALRRQFLNEIRLRCRWQRSFPTAD